MKKLTMMFLIAFFAMQLLAEPQNGVVYVVPNGTGTGASWADAMGNVQDAINLARTQNPAARKDVWVAGGVYEISVAINIVDSVNVYGSFSGNESSVAQRQRPAGALPWVFTNPTILKGKGGRLMQAGGHMDMETIIDGFVMEDGNGTGTALNNSGGALVVRGNVSIQNCILRNNTAIGSGGAAIMTGGAIRYCLIEENTHSTGANGGGGIFSNPPAGYPSYIENCVIKSNTTTIRGAGIGVQGVEMTYISSNKIFDNEAIDGTMLKPGAGIYSNSGNNRVVNNLIYNNTGGTVVYYNGGNLFNNTIVRNVGGVYLAGNAVNVTNNVVWGCATDLTGATPTSITGVANSTWKVKNNATYNPIPTDKGWDIDENIQFSSNNANGDVVDPLPGSVGSGPKFFKISNFIGNALTDEHKLNLDSVNWDITTLSPCVNAGTAVAVVDVDIFGNLRPQGFPFNTAKYDIGAYELPFYPVVIGVPSNAKGAVYSAMGELLPENHMHGYARGGMIELFFEADNAYKINKAYYVVSTDGGTTFDGASYDFTSELDEDGFWRSAVTQSFKVYVEWGSITALDKINNNIVKCYSTKDGIHINGVGLGDAISIYNLMGVKQYVIQANNENVLVPMPAGVYIVRVNNAVQKVIVE